MAMYPSENLTYFLCLNKEHKNHLGGIRKWKNLKIASEDGLFWLKGFTEEQANDPILKKIPSAQLFYSERGTLFRLHKLLPSRKEPALLWTAIQRGLSFDFWDLNHNFFEIKERLNLKLVPQENATKTTALVCSLQSLKDYASKAPWVRLKPLKWCLIDGQTAFLLGTPTLPLQGLTYWQKDSFLIPAGYGFHLPFLQKAWQQKMNPKNENWVIFQENSTCFFIKKKALKSLSLGSIKQTY